MRHGKGVYVYTKDPKSEEDETPAKDRQTRYEGEWKDGAMHGIGKMTYPNGDVYFGTFARNNKHGNGSYTYKSNGDIYRGEFEHNEKHGEGTFLFGANNSQLKGTWQQGEITEGEWVHQDGTRYVGEFSGGRPIADGAFHFKLPAGKWNLQEGEFIERAIEGADDEDEVELIWQGRELKSYADQ